MKIFIRRNNDQRGPFDLFTIQQGLDSGKILPTDSAWYEGAAGWIFVSQLPGIRINSSAIPSPHPDDYKTRLIGDTPSPPPPVIPSPHPTPAQPITAPTTVLPVTTLQPVSVGCLPMFGAFLLTAIIYLAIGAIIFAIAGETAGSILVWLVYFGSIIWVVTDATNLKSDRGQVTGFVNMPPWAWGLSCLLLWAVAFPAYLVTRIEIRKVNDQYPAGPPLVATNKARSNGAFIVGIGCALTVGIAFLVIVVLTIIGNRIQNTFNTTTPSAPTQQF